jgi:hypothetical protein
MPYRLATPQLATLNVRSRGGRNICKHPAKSKVCVWFAERPGILEKTIQMGDLPRPNLAPGGHRTYARARVAWITWEKYRMDEVRRPKPGVRLSAADRIGAAIAADSEGRRLLVSLAVVGAVLAVALGITLFIWRDVGDAAPAASTQVQEIEQLLSDLSFTPGTVDGVMDADTADAIRSFQQAAGLPEDGLPSPGLLEELKAVAGQSN